MLYGKVRTHNDEISLWLAYSTYRSTAQREKTVTINNTAIISINYKTQNRYLTKISRIPPLFTVAGNKNKIQKKNNTEMSSIFSSLDVFIDPASSTQTRLGRFQPFIGHEDP